MSIRFRKKKILDLSHTIDENSLILGPSGSGKSTLLHLISGMLTPSQGEVMIDEVSLNKMPGNQKDLFRATHLGVIPQRFHLVPALTVKQNLSLPSLFSKTEVDKKSMLRNLETLGLTAKVNKKPHELSVGEIQRVSILRAFVNKPKYLLADEPTSALDDNNCDRVIELLFNQANKTNTKLIIATHDHRLKKHFKEKIELS